MRLVVDEPLTIQDFNLWVLSRALMEDPKKYQEGLKYLENAKKNVSRVWRLVNSKHVWIKPDWEGWALFGYFHPANYVGKYLVWRVGRSAHKAASLFEQALSRKINHYPYDDQQIFLLVENELRKKGFTTGYQFNDPGIVPVDRRLEDDLEKLSSPLMQKTRTPTSISCVDIFPCPGPIDIRPYRKSISLHYILQAGTGEGDIFDPDNPFKFFKDLDLFSYRILRFVERSERVEKQLRERMGSFIDELSNRINGYGRLASGDTTIKELYSLSTTNELARPWREMMERIELSR